MKNLVIFGTGGFGREVAELVEDINAAAPTWNLIGWLDGNAATHGHEVHGLPILGNTDWLTSAPETEVVVAVGNPGVKRRIVQQLGNANFATLVHPTVKIRSRVQLGQGCVICEGTQITTNIDIHNHVIVNLGCTIGHDTVIHDYVTVAPGVNISGNVVVGEGSDLGTGSKIIQGLTIGDWSIIGAGAVVSKEIPANVTAVGVPAKVIKERENGWHLQ